MTALDAFTLYGASVAPPRAGYRNVSYEVRLADKTYNLLVHKDEAGIVERIKRTNYIGTSLHAVGLPVRYPLDTRILAMHMGKTYYASLYNYLPGSTIPWEAYTMKHIKLLGWVMATLHCAMKRLSVPGLLTVYEEYQMVLDKITTYLLDSAIRAAIEQKLAIAYDLSIISQLAQFLEACSMLPEQQPLHMDFVRGNVIFGNATSDDAFTINDVALTGIIDFEKAALGHPLFDIARTLSFLLVDCATKSQKQIYSYFLDSGYSKRGESPVKPISVQLPDGVKRDVLETAIDLFLLYDFYKFLRSNPYESLFENYHYVRTRDLLVARGLIKIDSGL